MAEQPKFKISDNADVTEVYCNKVAGAVFDGHAMIITFATMRYTPQTTGAAPQQGLQLEAQVTARIALSPQAASELAGNLNGLLNTLANQQKPATTN